MRLQALMAAFSLIQIKRNIRFLSDQDAGWLRFFYIVGTPIRAWVLYHYTGSVAKTLSGILQNIGWNLSIADASSYVVATLVALLALLSVRHWAAGFIFLAVSSCAVALATRASLGPLNTDYIGSSILTLMFVQLCFLLPVMLLQFSIFKRVALLEIVPVKESKPRNIASANETNEAFMSITDEWLKGEAFQGMRSNQDNGYPGL